MASPVVDARVGSVAELLERAATSHSGAGRTALARLLSTVERGGTGAAEIARLAHGQGGGAHLVGITGAPGAGKSTLTNELTTHLRKADAQVAVLAVDPSSPYSGGAILGDRIRMADQTLDDGVFIRSMATRGHLGGLSLATPAAARLLDAVGFDRILIETVGVGQVEVEIVGSADTCVVVVNPGWGDAVQANKAGLMEIADVFVVNKADRPGARETRSDLEQMLGLRGVDTGWTPPVLETVGTSGTGVAELAAALDDHREHLETSGEGARRTRQRLVNELRAVVGAQIAAAVSEATAGDEFRQVCDAVVERRTDPWTAATELVRRVLGGVGPSAPTPPAVSTGDGSRTPLPPGATGPAR
ncbi:MAG: methylmalonyl Co-A mutase-associated GTPase MeaB [Microthrixaceae bacterium]